MSVVEDRDRKASGAELAWRADGALAGRRELDR
jgi:hypothetical protein